MYVLAGAEGSINDLSLLAQALARKLKIPPYRYYIGDAGFGSRTGVVILFPNIRYHLQDWRDSEDPPKTVKELYNLCHVRLHMVVERTFGQLKWRFKIIYHFAFKYSLQD